MPDMSIVKATFLVATLLCVTCSFAVTETYCDDVRTATTCTTTMALAPRGTSSGVATPTIIQTAEPATVSNTAGSYFTYPDGSQGTPLFDVNDTVDVLWVTNATLYSISINCTLHNMNEYSTFSIDQSKAINNGILNGYEVDGAPFKLPNVSASCIMMMQDAGGYYLAESAYFEVQDATAPSSKTWGALPTSGYELMTTPTTAVGQKVTSIKSSTWITSKSTSATSMTTSKTSITTSKTSMTPPTSIKMKQANTTTSVLSPSITVTSISVTLVIPTAKSPPAAKASNASTHPALRAGVKAGIGIGSGVAALALIAPLFFIWRRRRVAERKHAKPQHLKIIPQRPSRADSLGADFERPAVPLDAVPSELEGAPFPELAGTPTERGF